MEKVIWSEGLFLRPQHLQQQDRYFDYQIRRRVQLLEPYCWGFQTLELDENLLQLGKVALTRAEGILPDGTLFRLPADASKPLIFSQEVEEGSTLCLVVPAVIQGSIESHEDSDEQHSARYGTAIREVIDSHGLRGQPVAVTTAVLRARLAVMDSLTEKDVSLPLCRIRERKPDGSLVLDRDFCPPRLSLEGDSRLQALGREVLSLIQVRARGLAERLTGGAGNISSVADLLLLQALNRYVATLDLQLGQPQLHPYSLYRTFTELTGELAALCRDTRLAEKAIPYDHSNPATSFLALYADLRNMLTRVFEQAATRLPVHPRKFGLTVIPLPDMNDLRTNDLILALKADVPVEQLVRLVPTRIKVGSIGKIRDIVNLQLPGCKLSHLPTAPRQLPYHAGYCYFRLEPQREIWNDVEQSGGFAVHVSGEVAGLAIEAWSLKR